MLDKIYNIAQNVREEMVDKYGNDLSGRCIESSDEIASRLIAKLGLDAVTVEGWCRFDDEYYGSDRPWDPHTWVEIPSINVYVDATADQFNFGMYSENVFSEVIVREGIPHGMRYDEPSWEEFEREFDFSDDEHAQSLEDLIRSAEARLPQLFSNTVNKNLER